jgi:hypothetical protein
VSGDRPIRNVVPQPFASPWYTNGWWPKASVITVKMRSAIHFSCTVNVIAATPPALSRWRTRRRSSRVYT